MVMRTMLLLWLMLAACAIAQVPDLLDSDSGTVEGRVAQLEKKVRELEGKKDVTLIGGAAFVAASVCALWAQNTRRSAFVWFLAGLFLMPFALIALLVKNSNDNFERRTFGRAALDPKPLP
jgi:hypothetical protein